MRFEGRSVIVTGAASGIGLRIATAFANEGANVAIVDIREDTDAAAASVRDAIGLRADVGKNADVEEVVSLCIERFGRVDCIVNDAAAQDHFTLDNMSEEVWERVFDVNFRAALLFARTAKSELIYNRAVPSSTSRRRARTSSCPVDSLTTLRRPRSVA